MEVIGNHFIGGTISDGPATGQAIFLGATTATAAVGSGEYALPAGWTVQVNLGNVIEDNVIQDSLGGINIAVDQSPTSETTFGRVYITATIVGNTSRGFKFSSDVVRAVCGPVV